MHISDIYSLGETIKALVMLLTPISIIHIALSNKRRHCFFYSIRVKSRFFLWISWQTTLTLLGVCWYNERHLKFRLFSVASLLVACARDAATDNDILWRIHNKKNTITHNAVGELVICEVNRKKENSVYRIERTLPHQVRDNCISKSWAKILEITAMHHYRQTHLDSGETCIYILILLESSSVIFLQLMIRNKYFVMLRLTQVFFCARSFMLKTRPERRE